MNRRGWLLLAAWCVLLAAGVAWIQSRLHVSADLRLFMPKPRGEQQRLLVQNIGESPASRLLLVALDGDAPPTLAAISKRLAIALGARPEFGLVANGAQAPLAIPDSLLPYRYLLTDSFDLHSLDAGTLESALAERAADMASPAAPLLEDWLPRDPTLEVLHLVDRWQPGAEPQRVDDAWFTADGRRALLLVETRAAAFDPDGQTTALDVLRAEFERARGASAARLTASGSGYFSSIIRQRTQAEASWFGGIATAGMILLLWFAYRHLGFTLLGALPLASGALAGLAAVSWLFESVHGITLAFGFTLIGVAQDYPMHLFSHLHRGESALVTARRVWPPLATGVASTCIAYLAFLASGVTGLAQLACLTVSGLIVAGLSTRYLLPRLTPAAAYDPAGSALLQRINRRVSRLPRPFALLLLIPLVAALVFWLRPEGFWQNDLSRLTPVPPALLRQDLALRHELATPDLRYLLVAGGVDEQDVLMRLEALDDALREAVNRGAIGSYDHAARYLPSEARQRARQAKLPDAVELGRLLHAAAGSSPFDEHVFAPFLADVERARELRPLARADLAGTPLALRIDSALFSRDARWYGLVSLFDVHQPAAMAALGKAASPYVTFLDLKAASEELVAVIYVALRRATRVLRVLAPMVLTTLIILAVLRACGVSLNLFHLISLVLAAGLGLDYALFFEHASDDPAEQQRTLHALLVCALSTLLVFALLALSTVPVLAAIGVTVSLGVVCNFLLALLLTRERTQS